MGNYIMTFIKNLLVKYRQNFDKYMSSKISENFKAGYTLFANNYKTWIKWKFCQKNCKFTKLDENHATHYSSTVLSFAPEALLQTIHRCLRAMTKLLSHKKNWVLQNATKRGLHDICHILQFSQMCVATENTTKKVLWICQKTASSGKRISWKFFPKCSRIWRITLSTLFAFHMNFVHSFLFRHCL